MKIIACNGSPRKQWNTGILLDKALEGAASQGAETELIQLYDMNYKGCISCFACKLKGGKSYGKCACKDDLTPVLEKIGEADGVILGSPIYLSAATASMRALLERMVYPYLVYDRDFSSLLSRKIPVGMIYTMGVDEERMKLLGYAQHFQNTEMIVGRIFGQVESLCALDTYQFDDYSRYESSAFDPVAKKNRRDSVFLEDCQKAFDMGARFAAKK